MDEQKFKTITNIYNIYNDFQNNLHNNIKNNNEIIIQSEDCYLIEEPWINEFSNNNENKSLKNNISLPNSYPIFINNIENIISKIYNSKKLKLVNKKLFESLFNQSYLNKFGIIHYYGGNNKIIIEYKHKQDNKALLLINPLDKNIMKKNVFIIFISNEYKSYLYKDLLSEKDNSILIKKYKNYLITLENYIKNNQNIGNKESILPQNKNIQNLNNENNISSKEQNDINEDKESFKREILKILIYIFYYKKYISDNGEKKISPNQLYYLISKDWLVKYLQYYDYQILFEFLLNDSKYNKQNYINIDRNMENNIEELLKKNVINLEKEKFKDSIKFSKIIKTNNNDLFFKNSYIIPFKIINLINKNISQNKVNQRKIFVKNKYLYFKEFNNIIIGNLDKNIFIPKYILSYNTKELLYSEKEIFDSILIEEYLQKRLCNNDEKEQKDLIDQNKKIIGKLIPLIGKKVHKINSLNNLIIQIFPLKKMHI